MTTAISHALVLPDENFNDWLAAARPYMSAFERVGVVRSPAGNDLNRFRNVTAIQAPGVWIGNAALNHIRRAYPMVVRVDVITVQSPGELTSVLQRRINNNDRYGEQNNSPKHIFDRFVIDWPTDARPTRITRPYADSSSQSEDTHEGFDIATFAGSKIMAGVTGRVSAVLTTNDALGYGAYVQITSTVEGEKYIVTFAGLRDIKVRLGENVVPDDQIAEAAGTAVKVVVQNPPNGTDEFQLPNVVNPVLMIYWQGLRVRPTDDGLFIRSRPNTDSQENIIGQANQSDLLEPQEVHGRTLAKVGRQGQWLRLRRAGVREAYAAAWFLEVLGLDDPVAAISGTAVPGMNLDLDNRNGTPNPNVIQNLGWVRLLFNVSLNPNFPEGDDRRYGNTDVNATFNRYKDVLARYAQAGIKVVLVFTHQTFGEGQGFVWPRMDSIAWRNDFTPRYVETVRQCVQLLSPTGHVYAYQIWNEQDTEKDNARAAVPLEAADYGYILGKTIQAIRTVDRNTTIITGGHVTGPENAVAYAHTTFANMPAGVRPDGVAFHPYGRGAAESIFSRFGTISAAMDVYRKALPGKPVWLTEWGILDRQGDDGIAEEATRYATGFLNELERNFPGQVACAIWYAWADGMDNGYGLVRENGTRRDPLHDTFLSL